MRRCCLCPAQPRCPAAPAVQLKNSSTDMLDGKVGRIYMPKQSVDTLALHKMKGLKRERRHAAAASSDAKKAKRAKPAAAAEEEEAE